MTWLDVQHLFIDDDGSLPDVFIEGLSRRELVEIYTWIMGLTEVSGDPTVWSVAESKDLKVRELTQCPVELFLNGSIESFRHGLIEFKFDGVKIPQLTIAIFEVSAIEFDYRMGDEWRSKEAAAFFEFLAVIKQMAPAARISRAEEGRCKHPDIEFEVELQSYVEAASETADNRSPSAPDMP